MKWNFNEMRYILFNNCLCLSLNSIEINEWLKILEYNISFSILKNNLISFVKENNKNWIHFI